MLRRGREKVCPPPCFRATYIQSLPFARETVLYAPHPLFSVAGSVFPGLCASPADRSTEDRIRPKPPLGTDILPAIRISSIPKHGECPHMTEEISTARAARCRDRAITKTQKIFALVVFKVFLAPERCLPGLPGCLHVSVISSGCDIAN